LITAVVVATVLGVFGNGVFDAATSVTPDGDLRLEYRRVGRHGGTTELTVRATPPQDRNEVEIRIDGRYLAGAPTDHLTPEPDTWAWSGDDVVLSFAVEGGQTFEAILLLAPDDVGVLHGEIALGDGPPVPFTQLVLR
jgi:hypothetical protein